MAIGIKLNIPTTGRQRTVKLHTHAGFGADQFDRAGVHAAQGAGVDCQLRLGTAVIGACGGVQRLCIHVIATGNHGELARVDLRVDLGRAGDDFEAVDVARVQALAVNGHRAAVDLVAFQLTGRIDDGFAGGQGGVGGVDEAAAVATDAVGVGDDDLGRLTRYFGVAAQLAGVAAVDFVEDDAGRAALEVGVADDVAAQLGVGHRAAGVVEDHGRLGPTFVVFELVVRQATAVRCGDVTTGTPLPRRRRWCRAR